MSRRSITTDRAPAAVGPYTQAVEAGGFLWVSGQIALDPRTGTLVEGGIEAQTRQVMANLGAILEAGGRGLADVVRARVFMVDLREFEAMNRVYAEAFPASPPARVCVEVSGLPKGAAVEIEVVAWAP